VVLFGGFDGSSYFNDTWVWGDHGVPTWTQNLPSTSPSARALSSMARDVLRGQLVLFGGADANGNLLNDTWVY
jgi:hypothetical protein